MVRVDVDQPLDISNYRDNIQLSQAAPLDDYGKRITIHDSTTSGRAHLATDPLRAYSFVVSVPCGHRVVVFC
jgi:hypothetical protein